MHRSTYYKYEYRRENPAPRTQQNCEIRRAILKLHGASDKRMGVRQIRRRLEAEDGIKISVGRVYRLMKGMQLPKMSTARVVSGRIIRRKEAPEQELYRNFLRQNFTAAGPNQVWLSDITYIHTKKGMSYVCMVMDLFSRKIIGYGVRARADADLVVSVVQKAYNGRGRPKGVIFHSDRGTQYTSLKFRRFLDSCGFVQSFSARGCPYDNAVMESFFKTLKREELKRRDFTDCADVSRHIFEYIEGYYNYRRPHSANNELSPDEKEAAFMKDKKK